MWKIFHQLSVASGAANLPTLTFGAARRSSGLHAICRLVRMRSPMRNEVWRPRCCAQGKSFRLLVNMHLRKFWKYFIRTLLRALSNAVFRAVKAHRYETTKAATQPSVLQEPHAFYFIQGSYSLAKQILTWYRFLIFRASLPKKMKIQSQLLKAVCICPVRFSSLKKCMARYVFVHSTPGGRLSNWQSFEHLDQSSK